MTENKKQLTDQELVQLSLQNKEHFLGITEKYAAKLLRYIRRISGVSAEDAEDLLQDIFIKVYISLNAYDPKQSFSSWIYRIARNETISGFRKKKARPKSVFLENNEIEQIAGSMDFLEEYNKKELKVDVEKIFEQMSPKYRDVLILKYLEEKDYKEISDILHKPMGSVATLLNRAKKQYKKILDKEL